jgi:acyl-CoA thioester hydrolase
VPREFRLQRRVQFHETDLAGMVHFSWYFRYMEEAEHGLWRALGLTVASRDDHLRFLRVAASCDYRAPLRFEDEFDTVIRVDALGSRSIRYACVITHGATRVANGSMTVACVDIAAKPPRAVDIPEPIAQRLGSE